MTWYEVRMTSYFLVIAIMIAFSATSALIR